MHGMKHKEGAPVRLELEPFVAGHRLKRILKLRPRDSCNA